MADRFEGYVTLDGSFVRELIRPERSGSRHLSVALAEVAPGQATHLHEHTTSEEVYYVLAGEGTVQVGSKTARVGASACILIPPRTAHRAQCTGNQPLKLLCVCSPPYQHTDTALLRSD